MTEFWMLRAFLGGADPLAARAYAGKDGFMMIMVMTMLMMMMIVMMMMMTIMMMMMMMMMTMMMEMVSLKVSHSQLLEVVGKLSLHSPPTAIVSFSSP